MLRPASQESASPDARSQAAPAPVTPISRRLFAGAALLGVFVLCDLGLFGWLIFRTLSQREINRVILETREEAQELASQIAGGMEGWTLDLATAVARESETQTYIDSVLTQRRIVQTVEIHDREGRVVFRSERDSQQGAAESELAGRPLEVRSRQRETPYDRVQVPVGSMGTIIIGVSRVELEERLRDLRSELLRQASVFGGLTIVLFAGGCLLLWRVVRRSRRVEQQAQEAERMAYVGTLAAGLAHEIRSPLNSLNLNMQLLEEEFDRTGGPPTGLRLTTITRGEISRLERLVSDFLVYARPPNLELERVAAAEPLRHVLAVLRGRLDRTAARIDLFDESGDAQINIDRAQMNQLLLNLMDNALAAVAEAAAPRIELRAQREDQTVVLSVADNGLGMSEDDRRRVFDAFFSKRRGGTGLGLAIAQRIARAHGAELRVTSAEGAGTRLDLRLAIASPPAALREETKAALPATGL